MENKPTDVAPTIEPERKQSHQQLINDLAALYAAIGMLATSFDTYDGLILISKSVERATEVVNVAKHHPGMLKVLKELVKTNDYIVAISGHGLMLYAMMAHHGRVPVNETLLQQTGYGDIPIAQKKSEELFAEAVPQHVPVEQLTEDDIQGRGIYDPTVLAQIHEQQSPLHYTVPNPELGAWEVETPVGGDGQNRT